MSDFNKKRDRARLCFGIAFGAAISLAAFAMVFELGQSLHDWARNYGVWKLGDILTALGLASVPFGWYAYWRCRQHPRGIQSRDSVNEQLVREIAEYKKVEMELAQSALIMRRQNLELQDTKDRLEEQAGGYVELAEQLALARDDATKSELYYRTLTETSPVGIWQVTSRGQTLYANTPAQTIFEVDSADELMDRSYESFFTPESKETLTKMFECCLEGEASSCEATIVGARSGRSRYVEISGAPLPAAASEIPSALISIIDITERKEAESAIWNMARNDPVTGLPNRQLFHERLQEAAANADRLGRLVALMFLDLDHFKQINDTYGHPVGDALLRDVGEQLRNLVRETDTVARLGGDEFAVILTNMKEPRSVDMLATRIVEKISQPRVTAGCLLKIGASIGTSFYPLDGRDLDELIRKADLSLYQAKADGRGCYRIYDDALHSKVKAQVALENELRLALAREEFVLHYQPQICVATGEVIGTEALVRWRHPVRGMVPPGDWIGAAETSGLIVPIGEWVLRTACAQNKAWQNAGMRHFSVAVNISAAQFLGADLLRDVKAALKKSELAPCWLELEITESMVIDGVEQAIDKLQYLSKLGVEIAIDDFGTGYSSLAYLKRFPVHRLKIDRSFVQNIATDSEDVAIVNAVITLGRALNLKVIAEGVETVEQLVFLRDRGCDEAQGYYFARPLPAEDFATWMSTRPSTTAIAVPDSRAS